MSDWLSILKNKQADDSKIETYYEGLMKKYQIVEDKGKDNAYTSKILENPPFSITDSSGETIPDTDSELSFSNIPKPTAPKESKEYPTQLADYQDKIQELSEAIPRKIELINGLISDLKELNNSKDKWNTYWKNISEENSELRKQCKGIVRVLNKLVNRINGLESRRSKLGNLEDKLENLGIEEDDEDEQKRKSINFNYVNFIEDLQTLQIDVESLEEFADTLLARELVEPDLFMEGNNLAFHDDDNIIEDLETKFRVRITKVLKFVKSNTKNKSIMQLLFSEAEYPFGRLSQFAMKDSDGEHFAIPFKILGSAFLSEEDINSIPKTIKDKDGDTIDNPEYVKAVSESKEAVKKIKAEVEENDKLGISLNEGAMEFIIELDSNPIINKIKELDGLKFKVRDSDKMVRLQDILAEATLIFDDIDIGSKSNLREERGGILAIRQFLSSKDKAKPLNFDIGKLVKSIEEFKKSNSSMIKRKKADSKKIEELLSKNIDDVLLVSGESSLSDNASKALKEMDNLVKETLQKLSEESSEIKKFRIETAKKLNEARNKIQRTKEGEVKVISVIDPETKTERKTNIIDADIGNLNIINDLENEINKLNKEESKRKQNIEAFLDSLLIGSETLPRDLNSKFVQLFSTVEAIKQPLKAEREGVNKLKNKYLKDQKEYLKKLKKYNTYISKKKKLEEIRDKKTSSVIGDEETKEKREAERKLRQLKEVSKPKIRKPTTDVFDRIDKKYKNSLGFLDNKIDFYYESYLKSLRKDKEFLDFLKSKKTTLSKYTTASKDKKDIMEVIIEIEKLRKEKEEKAKKNVEAVARRTKITGKKKGEKSISSLLKRKAKKIELIVAKQSMYEILYDKISEAIEEYIEIAKTELKTFFDVSSIEELESNITIPLKEDTRKTIDELRKEFRDILNNEKEISKGFEFRLFGEGDADNKFLSGIFESLINENDKLVDSYIKTSKSGDIDFKEATAFFSINASKFEQPLKLFKTRLDILRKINNSASTIYNLSDVIKETETKLLKSFSSDKKEELNPVSGYTDLETLAVKINNIGRVIKNAKEVQDEDGELQSYIVNLNRLKEDIEKASKEINKGLNKIKNKYSYSIIENKFKEANGETEEMLEEVEENVEQLESKYNRDRGKKVFTETEGAKEKLQAFSRGKLDEYLEAMKESRKKLKERKKGD